MQLKHQVEILNLFFFIHTSIKGQFFSGTSYRIYLLGNPVIWWSNLIFLLLFVVVFLYNAVLEQRRAGQAALQATGQPEELAATTELCSCCPAGSDQQKSAEDTATTGLSDSAMSLRAAAWLFIGWLLHYLPFWAMGRVLYFHHYFPALIFNSLLTGKCLAIGAKWNEGKRRTRAARLENFIIAY